MFVSRGLLELSEGTTPGLLRWCGLWWKSPPHSSVDFPPSLHQSDHTYSPLCSFHSLSRNCLWKPESQAPGEKLVRRGWAQQFWLLWVPPDSFGRMAEEEGEASGQREKRYVCGLCPSQRKGWPLTGGLSSSERPQSHLLLCPSLPVSASLSMDTWFGYARHTNDSS